MTFLAAKISEQGVAFAIVAVKPHVLHTNSSARECAEQFGPYFPGHPLVLMAQDSRGRATYWGRPDIVRFLSRVSPSRIPWSHYRAS